MPEWTEQDLLSIEKDIKKDYRQSIPKFNGEFFLQFKERLMTWISMKGLHHHLLHPLDSSRVSNKPYMRTRELTKFVMHNTISNKILGEHPSCKDPYDLWRALSLKYEQLTMVEQVKLGNLVCALTLSECDEDIDKYMNKVDIIVNRIVAGGGEVSVKEWVSWLLSGLDSRFSNFPDTLLPEDLRDVEKFKAKLRESARTKLQFEDTEIKASGNSASLLSLLPHQFQGNRPSKHFKSRGKHQQNVTKHSLNQSVSIQNSNPSQKQGNKSKNNKDQRNRVATNSGKYCAHCKTNSHWDRDCKSKDKFCTFCNRGGHTLDACFTKKRAEGNQEHKNSNPEYQFQLQTVGNATNTIQPGTAYGLVLMYNSTAPAEKVTLRDPSIWICDSGATCHATWNRAAFNTLQPHKQLIAVANGKYCFSEGLGNITLSIVENGRSNTLELTDVLYIPEMETQLLSENRATAKGMQILKSGTECLFIKDNKVAFKANQSTSFGNLWIIRDSSPKVPMVNVMTRSQSKLANDTQDGTASLKDSEIVVKPVPNKQTISNYSQPLATIPDLTTLHTQTGHVNYNFLQRYIRTHNRQIQQGRIVCETCAITKSHRKSVAKVSERQPTRIGEIVHGDLIGPFEVPSKAGYICLPSH
jgi:hypothetical protein